MFDVPSLREDIICSTLFLEASTDESKIESYRHVEVYVFLCLIIYQVPRTHLYLDPLEQQLLPWIRAETTPELDLSIPLRLPIGHLHIIVQNHLCDDHLDLIGCEETSRTCVSSIAKRQILLVRGYELITRMIGGVTSTAQVVVSIAIKFLPVGPKC